MKKGLIFSTFILGLLINAIPSAQAKGKTCEAVLSNCKDVNAELNCHQCKEICEQAVTLCKREGKLNEMSEAQALLDKCTKACSSKKPIG